MYTNEITLILSCKSENEGLARMCISGFLMKLDPTIEELNDIKTALSEGVTNAIIHGYEQKEGEVILKCRIEGRKVYIEIKDKGVGIENIEQATTPMYTSKPQLERSGMGFTIMETFMDDLEIISNKESGTIIRMHKTLCNTSE